ncbi:DNA ligase 1 [Sporothrix schenckii 1099-18]|uniref:DNA ligase n=2 Tax=Sporothrix schenckii TaxID=29908 RepID=U7Q134_SPOS1|nr:DNA ligase 1 [Sporothrix schenckii 1099-18]ERT01568.1 hypothetical protein HMPREF1624_02819 [Sporothrix schenckii ATCC 58251]KJR88785.1 DNA ligase 1 [Sporothrix schenckii 1099-18]
MPSPAKKRKLNAENAKGTQPRGLEYFFSKQRQTGSLSVPATISNEDETDVAASSSNGAEFTGTEMTDEELARKLQAEWDEETRREQQSLPILTASEDVVPDVPDTGGPQQEAVSPLSPPPPSSKNTLSLQSVTTAEDAVAALIPLDESPLVFEPSKYIPALKRQWAVAKPGGATSGDASYALLTRCFVLVNATQSRIKIVDTLVNCLRLLIEADPESLLPAVWLATNAISPPYISLELGLGGSAIGKALKQVCGLDARSLRSLFHKYGDPGDVAFEAKKKQAFTLRRPQPLTIRGVYLSLVKVANSQGPGSVEAKQRIVDRLLQDARGGDESRYIVRTLCQHLRIGAVKTTMLIALSRAFLLSKPPQRDGAVDGFSYAALQDPKLLAAMKKEELAEVWARAEETVKACFARRPNYNDLVPVLLEIGVTDELLLRCGLALHIPLRPMLGSITRDLGEMLGKLQGRAFTCEYKYDGQRAQVHCDRDGKVSIFSRHLEVMTDKYPDLVSLVPRIRGEGVESFILEGEVVAVDRESGELRTFQALTNRARKDVAIGSITIDVCLFAFDLMFLNGQPLLDRPLRERRELLRSLFVEIPHHFTWVKSMDATSEDGEAVSAFFKSATDAKCEGIMVKILDNLPDLAYTGDGDDEDDEAMARVVPPVAPVKKKPKSKATANAAQNGGDNGAEKKTSGRRKPLLATYEPDKRLDSWLKVKKDYGSTFDTLDLIPIAAWHGMGRKAKWWSPILMAVRNEETGSLEAVTKCISGFTDAFYKANRAFYDNGHDGDADDGDDDHENEGKDGMGHGSTGEQETKKTNNTRTQKPSFVEYYGPEPDVWFEPQEVWEMAFADITLSPVYTAAIGLVNESRGLSLRFPRFLRKREDKGIDEASTSEFLAGLYRKQDARAPDKAGDTFKDAEEEE